MPDLSDYFRTFEQISARNGFAVECHDVETEDGYVLKTFRIQPNETAEFAQNSNFFDNINPLKPKKPAVLL